MSVLGSILDKIFHHASSGQSAAQVSAAQSTAPAQPAAASQPAPSPAQTSGRESQGAPASGGGTSSQATGAQKLSGVDVDAVLSQLASKKGGGGNWRTSIVDLLKLLDLDSSLDARKQLASELSVRAGADGSAEQNIALQKAVMTKLAENGGKVPDSLRR